MMSGRLSSRLYWTRTEIFGSDQSIQSIQSMRGKG